MAHRTTFRIRAELALAVASGLLSLVTLVWRDWLEAVFGWDPDHHSGSAELLIVVALASVAVLLALLARWERRRLTESTQGVPS